MPKFDADIGWLNSSRMVMCTCDHHERSHRPMSRKCSLCTCEKFTPKTEEAKHPQSQ